MFRLRFFGSRTMVWGAIARYFVAPSNASGQKYRAIKIYRAMFFIARYYGLALLFSGRRGRKNLAIGSQRKNRLADDRFSGRPLAVPNSPPVFSLTVEGFEGLPVKLPNYLYRVR